MVCFIIEAECECILEDDDAWVWWALDVKVHAWTKMSIEFMPLWIWWVVVIQYTSLEGEMSNEADFEEQVLLNCF